MSWNLPSTYSLGNSRVSEDKVLSLGGDAFGLCNLWALAAQFRELGIYFTGNFAQQLWVHSYLITDFCVQPQWIGSASSAA